MSRTYIHAPYWTYATWYEPAHSIYCEHYTSRSWQKTDKRPCNLPAEPVRHNSRFMYRRAGHTCSWEPVWPCYRQARWLVFSKSVPRWYVNHLWHGPERVRERVGLRDMVKEFNGNGDLADGDFPGWQARHCAHWSWD